MKTTTALSARRRILVVLLASIVGVVGFAALPAHADAYTSPQGAAPSGANDWTCKPTTAHPRPVVLVHGLGANMALNWGRLSPVLKASGYCVFALTYGVHPSAPAPLDTIGGVNPMEESAGELQRFIDKVLAATGAAHVDLVGHSEGTVMPRYYLRFLDGAAKVRNFVALTPLYNGTEFLGVAQLAQLGRYWPALADGLTGLVGSLCGSCPQFLTGSQFLTKLNAGGYTIPTVTYTNIVTRYDQLVTPYTSGIVYGPNVTNIVLQDKCALDLSEHGTLAMNSLAFRYVLNALDPAHAIAPGCKLILPLIGG